MTVVAGKGLGLSFLTADRKGNLRDWKSSAVATTGQGIGYGLLGLVRCLSVLSSSRSGRLDLSSFPLRRWGLALFALALLSTCLARGDICLL